MPRDESDRTRRAQAVEQMIHDYCATECGYCGAKPGEPCKPWCLDCDCPACTRGEVER